MVSDRSLLPRVQRWNELRRLENRLGQVTFMLERRCLWGQRTELYVYTHLSNESNVPITSILGLDYWTKMERTVRMCEALPGTAK